LSVRACSKRVLLVNILKCPLRIALFASSKLIVRIIALFHQELSVLLMNLP
jgi:hypothetical protein